MICPSCGRDNRAGRKFCSECGAAFEQSCPSCQAVNEPGEKFCGQCGHSLTESVPKGQPGTTTVPAPTDPTSFVGGRYQVKKLLGEGGKKRVYLAHDTVLDREVAIALIKTEGLDEAGRARITREAQAMGRLGDHPHILPIHDLGEEPSTGSGQAQGQPYMVLPLVPGGEVEGLIDSAPDHRIPLERAIEITRQVCRGLEFAHSRGIVHRDLKPGNVWLAADGAAKIGDFGLAVAMDRSRLTQEGMMVGTVSYMPPEQAMGSEVTPQADLYSLGAMLYEMVTGRPPFLGDDSVAIIGQHINTPPVAPTWHNAQCPKPLEALILRLLAKDPSERPESAADVLTALEGIDLTDVGVPMRRDESPEDASRLDSLAGGVFVGRQREMGELKAAREDALSGRGRMVTLVGEPGIGKTRTAQELVTYAGLRQAQVLWGRGYEGQGVPPYWPWVQAIRSYVREKDPDRLRSEMGAGAADIAEIISDVKERLPDLEPPPRLEAEEARFRLFDSITSFLKGASRTKPLVLVLDDLHWADESSLLLLQFLARELEGSRLLVVGTYRDVELSRRHPLAETLAELTRERLFQRVLLKGLTQEDVDRFIEVISGIAPPRGLVSVVHTQTEGNPLFVTEVVRLLVQEGSLAARPEPVEGRAEERKSWDIRIPEGVREVIGRRLNRLSQRCNETLTIASVIGRGFGLDQLRLLVEDPSAGSGQRMTEDRLLETLEEALTARVIEELPRTVGRYQFTHALIQETLSEELSITRRVRRHAQIAGALEELYGADTSGHAEELAYHFAEAEAVLGPGKLVRYSLLAGERALGAYAYEEALSLFERALAAKEGQAPIPTGREGQAGQVPSAVDGETAALLFGLGRAQMATLPMFDIERALRLVPAGSHQAGRLLAHLGSHVGLEGDYQGAREAFSKAIAIAERENDIALKMRALTLSAHVWAHHSRWQDSVEATLAAIELAQQANDLFAEAQAHFYAAIGFIVLGDLVKAQRHADAGLQAAEKSRYRPRLSGALMACGWVAAAKGDWETQRDRSDLALELEPREARNLGARALLEHELGNLDEGDAYTQRLVAAIEGKERGDPVGVGYAAMTVPLIGYKLGMAYHKESARAAADVIFSSPTRLPLFEDLARMGLGLIAIVDGDGESAARQYDFLSPRRGICLVISSDRLLGLLARTMGRLDDAAGHFEDALSFCRKGGYGPELAGPAATTPICC